MLFAFLFFTRMKWKFKLQNMHIQVDCCQEVNTLALELSELSHNIIGDEAV